MSFCLKGSSSTSKEEGNWSQEEEDKLLRLCKETKNLILVSRLLFRTVDSCSKKLTEFGFTEKVDYCVDGALKIKLYLVCPLDKSAILENSTIQDIMRETGAHIAIIQYDDMRVVKICAYEKNVSEYSPTKAAANSLLRHCRVVSDRTHSMKVILKQQYTDFLDDKFLVWQIVTREVSVTRRENDDHIIEISGHKMEVQVGFDSLISQLHRFFFTRLTKAETYPITIRNDLLEWTKKDKRRLRYVAYRVRDIDRSIKFYTCCFGMKLLRKRDVPDNNYSSAILGFGPEDSTFVVELRTKDSGINYIGNRFKLPLAISTEDVSKIVEDVRAQGGNVTVEPTKDSEENFTAFVKDPDHYTFKLIQKRQTLEPSFQVMLQVDDMDRSINFYEKALGMRLLRKIERPQSKDIISIMGYGEENDTTCLALSYIDGSTDYSTCNDYVEVGIGTNDARISSEVVKIIKEELGVNLTIERKPLSTKMVPFFDLNGWSMVLVENESTEDL